MNEIFTIMKFSIKDMVKRKSFIISNIVILILIIVGFNIPNILNMLSLSNGKEKILISDKYNIFEQNLSNLNNTGYELLFSNDTIDEIKEKVLNDEIDSGIFIQKTENSINLTYIIENEMLSNELSSDFLNTLTDTYKNMQIEKLNLTDEEKMSINPVFTYDIMQVDEMNTNETIIMIMLILLFFAIYYFSIKVSSSITIEKTSKIIETLVTSTNPRNIVLGKTIGIGIVGLFQIVLIIIVSLISAKLFVDQKILSNVLDLSSFNILSITIMILYFILGYTIYACLYAFTGSMVNKPEDVQSANMPVSILSMIAFYMSFYTMSGPASEVNLFASYFPLASPFCMPFRYILGVASFSEVLLSLVILIASIVIISHITIKIYSNAILNYGTKLSIKNIIQLYKQK